MNLSESVPNMQYLVPGYIYNDKISNVKMRIISDEECIKCTIYQYDPNDKIFCAMSISQQSGTVTNVSKQGS